MANDIVIIDEEKCIACGKCVKLCPSKILYIEDKKCKVTHETKCDKMRGCEQVCPTKAIRIK